MYPLRLQNHFQARPRFSNKLPALYLDSLRDPADVHHLEVYLVNNSGRPLEFVASPQPLLWHDTLAQAPLADGTLRYEQVAQGEAVKIADLDEVYDSDFILQIDLQWQHPGEPLQSARISGKGIRKFSYRVLQWLHND